jgi:hypothetical protein
LRLAFGAVDGVGSFEVGAFVGDKCLADGLASFEFVSICSLALV